MKEKLENDMQDFVAEVKQSLHGCSQKNDDEITRVISHLVDEVEALKYVDVSRLDDVLGCTRMAAEFALTDMKASGNYALRFLVITPDDPTERKKLAKVLTSITVSMEELLANRDKIQKVRRPDVKG